MIKVTDPDLLAKLNSGELKKVTDPDLLRKLNSTNESKENPTEPQKSQDQQDHDSAIRYGIKDPLIGLLNFGSRGSASVNNLLGDKIRGFVEKLGGKVPQREVTDFSEMLGVPKETQDWRDKVAQFGGEIAPALLAPETEIPWVSNALMKLPAWGKYLKSALGNSITQGGIAATQSQENQGKAALEAGAITAPFSALSEAVKSGSQTVRNVGRVLGGLGGLGLGYYGAKSVGAPEPAADLSAILLGALGAKGGNLERRVREDMLKGVKGTDYQDVLNAGERLGVHVRPSEASGNPYAAGMESAVGKSPQGSQKLYESGQKRSAAEEKSIEDLFENIFSKERNVDNIHKIDTFQSGNIFGVTHNPENKVISPNSIGMAIRSDGRATVIDSKLDEKYQGKGIGKSLYRSAIDEAKKRGLDFESDDVVSDSAMKVYKSLEKDGYKFEYNPKIEKIKREDGQIAFKSIDDDKPVIKLISSPKNKNNYSLEEQKNALYKMADATEIPQSTLDQFKDNEIFKDALKAVKSEAAYREKLKGVPENSVEYLNQIKEAMDDMIENAPKKQGRIIRDTKNSLISELDKVSPEYKQARQLAERDIVRREIEDLFNKKDETGTNLFKSLLSNKRDYTNLQNKFKRLEETASNPEQVESMKKAQQQLEDMKLVFGRLIPTPTARTAAALGRQNVSQEGNLTKTAKQYLHKLLHTDKYDVAAVKLITNPKWADELEKLSEVTDKQKLMAAFHNLLGKAAAQGIAQ